MTGSLVSPWRLFLNIRTSFLPVAPATLVIEHNADNKAELDKKINATITAVGALAKKNTIIFETVRAEKNK